MSGVSDTTEPSQLAPSSSSLGTTGDLQRKCTAQAVVSAQAAMAMKECVFVVEALQANKEDICRVRMLVAVSWEPVFTRA